MLKWQSFDDFLAEARQAPNDDLRQQLVNDLLAERQEWPWIEGSQATFVFSKLGTERAALNLDTIKADPPFAPMQNLAGTTLWYVEHDFAPDDLLDYMLAVNDPMTPLATERDIVGRVSQFWRVDPRNPIQMYTAQMNVSVLRMPKARPFPDWSAMREVPRGRVFEHRFSSAHMGFSDRKLWIYTPPGYESGNQAYPLLILFDGQWAVGPLQIPFMADALIKHGRMEPVIIAMLQSSGQADRLRDYVVGDSHYSAVMLELLPFAQTHYRIDSTNLGLGGVGVGAVAAIASTLKNPAVFTHLIMLSTPLGKGPAQEELETYIKRFKSAPLLPTRIFQSVGRYEQSSRFYRPAHALREVILERVAERGDVAYGFAEIGSGHGLVGFRSVFPEALAHVYPGSAWET